MKDEIDLIPTDKCQRFLQIATIILGASGQACPNYSKKNMFAIFLQYLKKELINEIEFLHADKYESLLAIDSMSLMWMTKHSQRSQNSKFAMYLNISKKKLKIKLSFCMQIN